MERSSPAPPAAPRGPQLNGAVRPPLQLVPHPSPRPLRGDGRALPLGGQGRPGARAWEGVELLPDAPPALRAGHRAGWPARRRAGLAPPRPVRPRLRPLGRGATRDLLGDSVQDPLAAAQRAPARRALRRRPLSRGAADDRASRATPPRRDLRRRARLERLARR